MQKILSLVALGGLIALPACTSGQSAIVPPSKGANLTATSVLQFAVGTANIAGTAGLNTVVTFRQRNGLAATLVNTPSITGPAGFVVPSTGDSKTDGGTASITGSPQTPSGVASTKTTFGQGGGAFAYGFAPLNINQTGTPNFGAYRLPFYGTSQAQYLIGPGNTYVSNFRDGTQAPGFGGYASGFTDFMASPIPGIYSLTVHVALGGGGSTPDFNATANLSSTALLPPFQPPTYVGDGNGGGTVSLIVPSGVSEALVFVADTTSGITYTLLTRTQGAQTLSLGDALGPIVNGVAAPSLKTNDNVTVYAVGFDYPAIEAAPIGANPAQSPVIVGANGQADVTTSDPNAAASSTLQ